MGNRAWSSTVINANLVHGVYLVAVEKDTNNVVKKIAVK
jgi:hypothetical protein